METIYTNKTVLRIIDDLLIWYDKLKEKYTFVQVWNYLPSYIYNMAYQERWCPLNKEGYANRTDILNFKDGYKIKDYDLAFTLRKKWPTIEFNSPEYIETFEKLQVLHHVKEANEEARAVFLSKFANNDNKVVKELTLELYGASLVGDKRHFFDGPYNADIRMSEGWRNAKSETIKNKINNADILADEFRKWLAEEFERDYAAKRLPNRMSRMHRSYKDDDDDSNAGSNKKRFGK